MLSRLGRAMESSQARILRLIAVFKLLKAALLVATGIGILKLVHTDISSEVDLWVRRLDLDPGSHFVNLAIQRVTDVPPHKLRDLGIATFIYAGLFATEGVGLWLLKRWAEWFTVIATGSLVPLEAYELYRHPSVVKTVVLLLNIAVVAYLVFRVTHEHDKPGSQSR